MHADSVQQGDSGPHMHPRTQAGVPQQRILQSPPLARLAHRRRSNSMRLFSVVLTPLAFSMRL